MTVPGPLSRRAVVAGLAAAPTAAMARPDAAYRWRNVRVGGGGFIPAVVFSRVERGLAYLRSDMGGAYRWDAAAARWIPLQDGMTESGWFGVESIAPDPTDADVVYMACGMYRRDPAAILRSANRGADWTVHPVPFRMGGNEDGRGLGERLAVDPNRPSVLFFGSRHDGLQRSDDRGATWRRVTGLPFAGAGLPPTGAPTNAGVSFVVIDPASGRPGPGSRTIFVGIADPTPHPLWRSDDGGETWAPVPTRPGFRACQGALDEAGRLYVTYCNGIGPNGVADGAVVRHDTRRGTWTDITPERPTPERPGGFMAVALDRQRLGTVAVASMNRWRPHDDVWRSTDAGETWTGLHDRSRRDVSSTPYLYWGEPEPEFGWWIAGLAIDPFDSNAACYTTGATIYATRELSKAGPAQVTWTPWVEGIEQTAVITLASPTAGPPLLSGFGDLSGFVHDDLATSPRTQFTGPVFGNTNTIDYAGLAPQVVVRSGTPHQRHGGPTLAWSEDYGRTWSPLTAPKPAGVAPPPPRPPGARRRSDPYSDAAIAVSADGSAFVVMTPQPVVTLDRGRTWAECRGLPLWARPVADRADPRRFYALAFETGVMFVSEDAGRSFAPLPTRGLPSDLAGDRPTWREQAWPLRAVPARRGELWLVSRHGLFRSRDGGRTFGKAEARLAVEALDFGAPAPGAARPTLYAIARKGTLRAIWRSDDEGRNWMRINHPRHEYGRRFRCIAADPRVFGRVYVGTDGRGIVYGEPG